MRRRRFLGGVVAAAVGLLLRPLRLRAWDEPEPELRGAWLALLANRDGSTPVVMSAVVKSAAASVPAVIPDALITCGFPIMVDGDMTRVAGRVEWNGRGGAHIYAPDHVAKLVADALLRLDCVQSVTWPEDRGMVVRFVVT